MYFALLGPLLVHTGDSPVAVTADKQRVLLAALLLRANQAVPPGYLAEALWEGHPPKTARVTLQNYVMRLRQALGSAGHQWIVTRPTGYMIQAGPDELDLLKFTELRAAGLEAARAAEWETASQQLTAALSLWRGQPLADVPSQVLASAEVQRLADMRLDAVEARIDADLHLGRHREVLAELKTLVAAEPLREGLHELLMLALYRSGQQAAALATYRQARRHLHDELGIDPGPALRQLNHQILNADPALQLPPDIKGKPPSSALVMPRQLPGMTAAFTGRAAELATLDAMLEEADGQRPGTVVISAIGGTAGVGKTALALCWAHRIAPRFPDGQLYVNLRGYDPGQPMPAADALAGFLRSVGLPGEHVPPDTDERAACYRSLLAGKRMLVLLDNASSAEQVRPLLPGSGDCVVVVTSRDSLTGLVVRDGAQRLDLDLLPLADAVTLLRALIGARIDAEPAAAQELARQCARLPLALRVAAELAVARPAETLADLVSELAGQRRLDLLDAGGDSSTRVRAVFSTSYLRLDVETARAFRLAGLHPGPWIDGYALAALTGTTAAQAAQALGLLARAHLVQQNGPARYGMHDLLRAYARELAEAEDGADGEQAALTRLFDQYLYTASAAMDTLFPTETNRRPQLPAPAGPTPPVAEEGEARAWLDAEMANLVAVIMHAADHGWPGHAIRLAGTVFRFLAMTGRYPEIITVCHCSLRAARETDDRASEAEALINVTAVDMRQGRYEHAAVVLQQALDLYEDTGDRLGQARALGNLGIARYEQGHYQDAARSHDQAREKYRSIGDRAGEARALNNLSIILLRQGRYQQAADGVRNALALHPDPETESYCAANLGLALLGLGRWHDATENLSRALARSRQTGSLASEAYCLTSLGLASLRQGHYRQAADYLRQALALSRKEGDRAREADALNGLGEVSLATGLPGHAFTQHTRALSIAGLTGDRYEQARAHDGLGRANQARGAAEAARRHWREALASYTDMGVPEADDVRARLAPPAGSRPAAAFGGQPEHSA